jgi:hypothetical protein
MSDHSPSIRRRIPTKEQYLTTPDTEPDSNRQVIRRSIKKSKDSTENKDPFNVNVTVLVKNMKNEDDGETLRKPKQKALISKIDSERHTQSDTEQIISEKQKKRRRPKRISRTTQTYECVFRRMEYEEHEELRPTSETEKNIQTRKSRLRPRTRSPKRHYPIYLSTDAFKYVHFVFFSINTISFLFCLELKKFYQNNFLKPNEMYQKHPLWHEVLHHQVGNY